MGFTSIKTYNYRNLENREINVASKKVFLIGENGQGKTNFLETVYLLCFGASFRTRSEQNLIRYGESSMSIQGKYSSGNGGVNTVLLKLENGKKEIRVNDKIIKDRKEIIENTPCIIFSHDDIAFVKGSPERRRWFFNQTMSLYDSMFIDNLRKYSKILKLRNSQLKVKQAKDIDIYDIQMATAGLEIQRKREQTIILFNEVFNRVFSKIFGDEMAVHIQYSPSWKGCNSVEAVIEHLERRRNRDIEQGLSLSGPQRDRILFLSGTVDFSSNASTGQLRLMSLLLRVVQAQFYTEKTGRRPIILLDDVLLELDARRRKEVLVLLPEYEQAFFTFLPDEQVVRHQQEKTLLYKVNGGTLINIWKEPEKY
ncbi:MAG: DNA replication and repair protein RecF [Spirochaetota bacterium]